VLKGGGISSFFPPFISFQVLTGAGISSFLGYGDIEADPYADFASFEQVMLTEENTCCTHIYTRENILNFT
jgi:hypothetical protein